MDRTTELKNILDYHDNLYYNQNSPELSDIEYDALKTEYLNLTGLEEYDYVPGQAQFKKYTHMFPIKSLGKINTIEQVKEELKRLTPFVIEPKYDGLTLVIYPDGRAVTRGDGIIGEDVTHNVSKFVRTNNPYNYPIRGEAIMPISVFNKINKQRELEGLELYKNPRNAMAGLLKNKDNSNIPKGLRFIAYELVGSKKSHMRQLLYLRDYYEIPDIKIMYYDKYIDNAIGFIENFDRSKLDYEIDGLVIKSNTDDSLTVFGETEHHPKNAVAYKFPNQGVWTRLLGVTWQVGRTGKVSPVAELEPVELMGSTISRATLHNIAYINGLGLQINSEVTVCKANEIIPAIIDCRPTPDGIIIEQPTVCPVCGSILRTVNDQIFCTGNNCKAKLLFRTKHMSSRNALNIEGLNEQTIQKFIDNNYITEPWDIFNLTEKQILNCEGFAKKSAKNLYDAIQKSKYCTLDKVIYASGIELVGRKVSKDIAKEFGSYNELIDISFKMNRLNKIDGIGDAIINSFISNIDVFYKLASHLIIEQPEEEEINNVSLKGKVFVITGDFKNYKPRTKLQELIESLGGKCSGSVSKNTNYLISNDTNSTTGKSKKAKDLGVTIITEEQFEELIGV